MRTERNRYATRWKGGHRKRRQQDDVEGRQSLTRQIAFSIEQNPSLGERLQKVVGTQRDSLGKVKTDIDERSSVAQEIVSHTSISGPHLGDDAGGRRNPT